MTSKERMILALNKERPDRLPVTVHQWQKYHLDTYMGGISALEAFEETGMDAAIQYFMDIGQFSQLSLEDLEKNILSTPEWQEEIKVIKADPDDFLLYHTVHTPLGNLNYKRAGNLKTTWITEYMIKKEEDLDLIKYMPVPSLNPQPVNRLYDEIGDRGILRGFVWGDQAGCWQHAACLMDINELILKCFDNPSWVHELLQILLEKKLQFIETMKGAKFDLVETGGGSASSTLISPQIHEEFCLPYDRKIHDALHSLGFKVTYHTCGGTKGIEKLIVANGTDASETLAPKSIGGNQEPWEFKAKIGNRLALIGGIDQFNVLTRGTEKEIRSMVRTLFEQVGYEGGYILSCADHFFDAPLENLKIYAQAAKECVY